MGDGFFICAFLLAEIKDAMSIAPEGFCNMNKTSPPPTFRLNAFEQVPDYKSAITLIHGFR